MNKNCEFDRKLDTIEDNQANARVSGDVIDSSNGETCVNLGVPGEVRVSSMELDLVSPESEGGEDGVRVSDNERSEEGIRACSESDGSVDKEMESRGFKLKNETEINYSVDSGSHLFKGKSVEIDGFDAKNERKDQRAVKVDGHLEVEKYSVSNYKSLLSEFDDYVANDSMGMGTSRASNYGFDVGDMVWGKVKSHPWWPGHIFNEAFASPSVRRTRRAGHVLAAFFGDSSYGWFDPAELIPFGPYFAEKSQQMNSRNFVKAVEEALDEASRRCGLGLSCKCRNPYNFRPSSVKGYFAVDVADYEPGGVYSANQIKKARDSFQPNETLNFVKQLALAPQVSEQKSIHFIKNKATVFALRKAVFEEFDETYAQAFGMQPSRPHHDSINVPDQPFKEPPRAPLSGPLVIAEALGSGKSSKKPMKLKDKSKKDRYLFKRRDEPSELRTIQFSQGQACSSDPPAYLEGSLSGDYVLQKREPAPQVPEKLEQTGFVSKDGADSSGDVSGKETVSLDQASVYSGTLAIPGTALDAKPSLDKEKGSLQEGKERVALDAAMAPTIIGSSDMLGNGEGGAMVALKYEESGKLSKSNEDFQQSALNSARVEGGQGLDEMRNGLTGAHPSPIEARHSGGVKKAKVLKRPLGDLSSESSALPEKKKKRKKKEPGSESNSDHPRKKKSLASVKGGLAGGIAGKSSQHGLAPREDSRVNLQKKDVGSKNSLLNCIGTSPSVVMGNTDNLQQLLSDLQALALDPFHGVERNSPAIILHCFLRFRSLVYQKSLVLSPPSESEAVEVRANKPTSSVGVSDSPMGENVRDFTPSKPVKALVRADDPSKAGRKRLPSDRQEEIASKRLKKINQLKSLAAEKKASQKTVDAPKAEGREQVSVAAPVKSLKPVSVKKMEPPARVVEPTMLVMKFPPRTSLPSVPELKARFGRFGSLDQSAIRVFWKSFTCRVVFMHKADAHAAYKYANGNNSLFGNVSVRYHIRELESSAPEGPESNKGKVDDTSNESLQVKEPAVERMAPALPQQPLTQSTVQLKSILKKQTGDDPVQVTGGRGTSRVKFILGGEETSRGDLLTVANRNNFTNNNTSFVNINNNASFADSGGAPSSVAMDFNSKNFQKVTSPSSLPPLLHLPLQFAAKAPLNNLQQAEVVAPRNSHNVVNAPQTAPPPSSTTIDISQQMLSLLTRCNDVVTKVTGLLGYVPYHSL